MFLGEGVTAEAFFCYFFAAAGKKLRENRNSFDSLFPLERLFSVPLLQRDFVSRCSRHASGTAQSCIKTKGQRGKKSLRFLFPLERLL
jgi:hypothetical protein